MQSPKEYLEEKIGPCVEHLFEHYLPEQNFKSIHDLFNVNKCYKLLMCMQIFLIRIRLREQVKSKIADLRLHDEAQNQTYNEMRKRNFQRIYEIIEQSYDILGWDLAKKLEEKDIDRMIDKNDMRVMIVFMEYDNTSVVGFITTLDESIQSNVMEVMQNSQSSSYHEEDFHLNTSRSIKSSKIHSKTSLQNQDPHTASQLQQLQIHMQKMESHIHLKDDEIKELKCIKQQLQQEVQEYKKELYHKNQQIELLKKRMVSYEEVDQLLIEKDEEISKLDKKLTEQELKSRLKQSQLASQNRSLHQKIIELDSKQSELAIKYEKQKSLIENINKQKDEAQMSMKKVINNLKQKNKSLMDKINDLQNQLIQARFQKEMKQKELNQLRLNQNTRKTVSENFPELNSPHSPLREDINASVGSFTGGNYSRLGEQLSIELDRIDIEDQFGLTSRPSQNKRFNELLQQNYSLKQQLQKLQSSGYSDSKQFKQLQDEIQKMKKKINILKRRNDEIENQRKEEIDLMVGIIDNCYLQSFGKVK